MGARKCSSDCGVRFIVATFCCKCLPATAPDAAATGPRCFSYRPPPLHQLQAPPLRLQAPAAAVRGPALQQPAPPPSILLRSSLERCISHVFINEPKTFHTVPLQPPANAAIRRTVGPLQSLARRCIFSCVLLITAQVAASSERQ